MHNEALDHENPPNTASECPAWCSSHLYAAEVVPEDKNDPPIHRHKLGNTDLAVWIEESHGPGDSDGPVVDLGDLTSVSGTYVRQLAALLNQAADTLEIPA